MAFKYCGFADEAGKTLKEQIDATKRAGWHGIEVRNVEGKNFTDVPEETFDAALAELKANGIEIACFGSQLANWARPITTDFQVDINELKRAIPRMHKAGAKLIRCMSYPNKEVERETYKREVFRRLKYLASMCEEAGVILAHENCNGFGGEGPAEALEMLAAVKSPAFKLIIDTGNNATHGTGYTDNKVSWEFYNKVKKHVVHVHIKAMQLGPEHKIITCYPDEDPVQLKILKDLKRRGYDGWISIEPHMAAAVHAGKDVTDPLAAANIYVEYARRLEALVAQA